MPYDVPRADSSLIDMLLRGMDVSSMPRLGASIVGTTADGRSAYLNSDNSVSTERTRGVEHPDINAGNMTHIPTIFDDQEMSLDDAINRILRRGRIMGGAPAAGMVVDPVTGRRIPSGGDPAARSRSIEVLPHTGYAPAFRR